MYFIHIKDLRINNTANMKLFTLYFFEKFILKLLDTKCIIWGIYPWAADVSDCLSYLHLYILSSVWQTFSLFQTIQDSGLKNLQLIIM